MCAGVAGYTSKLLIKDEYPDWTMCELTIRTRTSSEDIDFESVVGFENRMALVVVEVVSYVFIYLHSTWTTTLHLVH